jgi:hypothetical protein
MVKDPRHFDAATRLCVSLRAWAGFFASPPVRAATTLVGVASCPGIAIILLLRRYLAKPTTEVGNVCAAYGAP